MVSAQHATQPDAILSQVFPRGDVLVRSNQWNRQNEISGAIVTTEMTH